MIIKFWKSIRHRLSELAHLPIYFEEVNVQIAELRALLASLSIRNESQYITTTGLQPFEFKVFSQFGDDGIIQHLIRNIQIQPECRTFVEFGVEDYKEANTRFLLMHDNWRGLIMDSSSKHIDAIKRDPIFWKHELLVECAFIDRSNINEILKKNGFTGEIGLLSIDIDGNDYWVWESIEAVSPIIVAIEYNSVFGISRPVAIPYDSAFVRNQAHYSNLYWGASLGALYHLGKKKGYAFVGCNSAGNNAYFVRAEKLGKLKELKLEDGYVYSRFRESRGVKSELTHLAGDARLNAILDCKVLDVVSNESIPLGQLVTRARSDRHDLPT